VARYTYDGDLIVQERDAASIGYSDHVAREFTWGLGLEGGIGGLLRLKQDGGNYSYLFDGKGNVTALLDANANVAAAYQYDPFGVPRGPANTLSQPMQFSTKPYDEKTGLSYYGYRFYVPSIGHWLTRDPMWEAGGINLYGFVENNPINFIDPWGLEDSDPARRLGDAVECRINQSGLPQMMNAHPFHPFKWDETAIYYGAGVFALPGNKLGEPWGHPLFPKQPTPSNPAPIYK
jgi:RHS repeat-associated protein